MTLPRLASPTPALVAVCLGSLLTAVMAPAASAAPAHGRDHRHTRTAHKAHAHRTAHRRHHIYIPRMLPTVIPAAREGFLTVLRGRASWYGKYFQGMLTANDERYDRFEYTCAHKTLPFNTRLRVTNVRTGASVVVRVNDRGPFRRERIIDLSELAARPLGLIELGQAVVVAEIVPVTTPLGIVARPAHLPALVAADPNPRAKFTAYLLPQAATLAAAAPVAPAAISEEVSTVPAATTPALAPILLTAPPAAAKPTAATIALAALNTATAPPAELTVRVGAPTEIAPATALRARILALAPALKPEVEVEVTDGHELHRVVVRRLAGWQAAQTVLRHLRLYGLAASVRTVSGEPAAAPATPADGAAASLAASR